MFMILCIVNVRMWKVSTVAYFKMLTQHLHRRAEENQENLTVIVCERRFEPGIPRVRNSSTS